MGAFQVVGYEASENLEAACRNGFEVVGNLRVLVAQTDRAWVMISDV
jgi:hypothetical protein